MASARALLRAAATAQLLAGHPSGSTGLAVHSRCFYVSAPSGRVVQFNLSDIGEGIREVTVKTWHVKENDVVAQFDDICEVESDKATVSITSRFDGKVTRLHHRVGDKAFVGRPLVDIDVGDEELEGGSGAGKTPHDADARDDGRSQSETDEEGEKDVKEEGDKKSAENDAEDPYSNSNWNKSLATPAVRRIAMENRISLGDVRGTGKHGRVLKWDVLDYVDKHGGAEHQVTVKPLTSVQKVMTRTMTESLRIPQFLFCDEMDLSELSRVRRRTKEAAATNNVRLTFLPFVLKAVSKGLLEFPAMNSTFDPDRERITMKRFHNIGVAVDSPAGLLVPNVKHVEKLTVLEIAREVNRLQQLAAESRLLPADLAGGTFTVSNVGAIAGTAACPLVLPPEVAIVALGRARRLPRYQDGELVAKEVLPVSWSADHRILDGATVARCSEVVRYYLENPTALLMDL